MSAEIVEDDFRQWGSAAGQSHAFGPRQRCDVRWKRRRRLSANETRGAARRWNPGDLV